MRNLTRRDALLSTALLGMPERGLASAARTTSEPASRDGVTRSATRVRGFADPEMDFQLLRSLGAASSMGAAVGEVLAAARNISDLRRARWRAPCCISIASVRETTFSAPACTIERRSTTTTRSPRHRERTGWLHATPFWKPPSSCYGSRRSCRSRSSTYGCLAISCNRPLPNLGPARLSSF